jgi:hypothetical protein
MDSVSFVTFPKFPKFAACTDDASADSWRHTPRPKNMTYTVLGSALVFLELYAIASQRPSSFYSLPQAIRLLMPVVMIVGGLFRKPRAEWIPIVLLAVGMGLALNRDLTGDAVVAHAAVIACGLSAAWFGYNSTPAA